MASTMAAATETDPGQAPTPSTGGQAPTPSTGGHALARPSTSLAPRIVIAGGGFAGITTALELAKRCAGVLPVHITLVSAQNYFLFTPMLAEAATGAVESRHVRNPASSLIPASSRRR